MRSQCGDLGLGLTEAGTLIVASSQDGISMHLGKMDKLGPSDLEFLIFHRWCGMHPLRNPGQFLAEFPQTSPIRYLLQENRKDLIWSKGLALVCILEIE